MTCRRCIFTVMIADPGRHSTLLNAKAIISECCLKRGDREYQQNAIRIGTKPTFTDGFADVEPG